MYVGSFYLHQGLIVLHCGYLGLRYPKNVLVLKVRRQNVLCFLEYRDSFLTTFVFAEDAVEVSIFNAICKIKEK